MDEADIVTGTATVRECLDRGLLHRAVAVVVRRPSGEILLQRRSRRDRWHPGLLTLSCTGHVRTKETYKEAARRELSEELGITPRVRWIATIRVPDMEEGGLQEREHVGLFAATSSVWLKPDPSEVDEVVCVSPRKARTLSKGRGFTPDGSLLLDTYFRLAGDDPGPG